MVKKYTLEPTVKNVLNSIQHDQFGRSNDVKDFIGLLDLIEENMFISLDAQWGAGKTFYVRQIEQTLKYLSGKRIGFTDKELQSYFAQNFILNSIELNNTYLPIYYNSWLYDQHDDPLMSLLLVIMKERERYLDSKIDMRSTGSKFVSLLDSLQLPIGKLGEMRNAIAGNDILESIKTAEEVRESVKEIFNEIIVEHTQKLVIFIDELDRCRPGFAIEMLERIKHYFDDDRIIFVISMNKEQLVHTLEKYYGERFDSSGYLNRFFDMNIQLPACNMRNCLKAAEIYNEDSYWLTRLSNDLQKYYNLSVRKTLLYFGKLQRIKENYMDCLNGENGHMMSLFVPIICVLDLVDVPAKQMVLDGKGETVLKELVDNSESARKFIVYLGDTREMNDENYRAGWGELLKIYKFAFDSAEEYGWYEGKWEISRSFKRECLRICNEMRF